MSIGNQIGDITRALEPFVAMVGAIKSAQDALMVEYRNAGAIHGDSVKGLQKWIREVSAKAKTGEADPEHMKLILSFKKVLGLGASNGSKMPVSVSSTGGGPSRAAMLSQRLEALGVRKPDAKGGDS